MFLVDWFLNNLLHWEWGIAGRVKVLRHGVQSSIPGPPVVDGVELSHINLTVEFLSWSVTLTMCPKVGTTLMLMLLNHVSCTRRDRPGSGRTSQVSIKYLYQRFDHTAFKGRHIIQAYQIYHWKLKLWKIGVSRATDEFVLLMPPKSNIGIQIKIIRRHGRVARKITGKAHCWERSDQGRGAL